MVPNLPTILDTQSMMLPAHMLILPMAKSHNLPLLGLLIQQSNYSTRICHIIILLAQTHLLIKGILAVHTKVKIQSTKPLPPLFLHFRRPVFRLWTQCHILPIQLRTHLRPQQVVPEVIQRRPTLLKPWPMLPISRRTTEYRVRQYRVRQHRARQHRVRQHRARQHRVRQHRVKQYKTRIRGSGKTNQDNSMTGYNR